MKREVITTSDGSKTIFISEMDENYHSGHGALQEAIHVFIQNGIRLFEHQKEISVFEMGFGTGLNALLSLVEAEKGSKQINYKGIEAYPVEKELIQQLGYDELVEKEFIAPFESMHDGEWDKEIRLTPHFTFEKIQAKLEDFSSTTAAFDLVFYDAFGPRAQESMWNIELLGKMYKLLKPGGVLVTYCAKGQVKRDLKTLGFTVEARPGPPGKREMTLAFK